MACHPHTKEVIQTTVVATKTITKDPKKDFVCSG
jgi:hypothetical protein